MTERAHKPSWHRLIRQASLCVAEPIRNDAAAEHLLNRLAPRLRQRPYVLCHDPEGLMKYLCLVYSEESNLHSLPDSPKDSEGLDRKSTRLNSSHVAISYAVLLL